MKFLYFHGYNGSADSGSAVELQKALGAEHQLITKSFDYSDVSGAIIAARKFYVEHMKDAPILVGNSLGGWYANRVAMEYNVPVVLINPSRYPEVSLAKYGVSLDLLTEYTKHSKLCLWRDVDRLIFLSTNDTVVDPYENGNTLRGKKIWLQGEGHKLAMYDEPAKSIIYFANQIQGT